MPSSTLRRALTVIAAAAIAVSGLTVAISQPSSSESPATAVSAASTLPASKFVPVTPTRVVDTRPGKPTNGGWARLARSSAMSIDPIGGTPVETELGTLGVSVADVTAVVANITMVRVDGRGHATAWPTGFDRPGASTNNATVPEQNVPNTTILPLGLDGKISIYSNAEADYIVDVMGVMVESGASADGRFVDLGPVRHSDTRKPQLHVPGQTRYSDGEIRTVDLTPVGVPTTASAVVLNVTSARSSARSFVRVWEAGLRPVPTHSNVNVSTAGLAASNQVITGVNEGRIEIFTKNAMDVIIDVAGYFTGPTDAVSTDGLFVPATPGRLLDSRRTSGDVALTDGSPVPGGTSQTLQVTGRLDIPPAGVKAAAFNITSVLPAARGYITAYPARGTVPATSSVNYVIPGGVIANHALTTLSDDGRINLFTLETTHMVVDVTGYFLDDTGTPPAGTRPTKTIPADHPRAAIPRLPGGAANRPASAPYDFLFDRGEPPVSPPIKVTWDACRPIRYALNVDRADDEQIATMIDSIKHVELSTGLDFQFAGVTSAGLNIDNDIVLAEDRGLPYRYLPPDDDGSGLVDAVIGFSSEEDTVEFERSGVIGVGGSSRGLLDSNRRGRSGQGFALLDLEDLEAGNPTEEQIRIGATATHEIGHMVGLAHVDDSDPGLEGPFPSSVIRDQLMFPFLNTFRPSPTEFSGGDLLGLWELYNTTEFPCNAFMLPDVAPEPAVDVRTSLDR